MMHECKRLLNDSIACDGLLFPGRRATGSGDGISHLFVLPRAVAAGAHAGLQRKRGADVLADSAGSAAEQAVHGAGDAGTQHEDASSTSADSGDDDAAEKKEPPYKRPRREGGEVADDQDSEDNVCDLLAGGGAAFTDSQNNKKEQLLKTYTHRDDWLHRGQLLSDIDVTTTHATSRGRRYLTREARRRLCIRLASTITSAGHYALASTHVQVLRRTPKTVQNVGPGCMRSSANEGGRQRHVQGVLPLPRALSRGR